MSVTIMINQFPICDNPVLDLHNFPSGCPRIEKPGFPGRPDASDAPKQHREPGR